VLSQRIIRRLGRVGARGRMAGGSAGGFAVRGSRLALLGGVAGVFTGLRVVFSLAKAGGGAVRGTLDGRCVTVTRGRRRVVTGRRRHAGWCGAGGVLVSQGKPQAPPRRHSLGVEGHAFVPTTVTRPGDREFRGWLLRGAGTGRGRSSPEELRPGHRNATPSDIAS